MAFTIKMRFPLLLLLGVVFLAIVCASASAISSREGEEGLPPRHRETGGQRESARQEGEREEEERQHRHQPQHHQSHEKEQQEEDEEEERQHRHRPQHKREQREEEDEGRQPRRPQHGEREEEKEREHRRERHRGRDEEYSSEEEEEDEEGSSSEYSSVSRGRKNPFYFSSSNRFETVFKNENGRIRLLERLDKRNSNLFQNLQKYRLAEFRLKPRTLLLPQHIDADLLVVVLKGKAILTVVNQTDKNSFNLENGDAIKIPAGTLAYLANRDDKRDLKVVHLVIPVNSPTRIQTFFPSSNQNQQSYFQGFSRGILEASFNTNFEEIEKVLLQEEQRKQKQGQEANIIVKVSREVIEELSKDAKSSSTKPPFSKSEPFHIQSRPIYSNKFGRFSEITSNQTPQLEDLDLFLSLAEIKEGALFLPHYNSRANIILVVTEGRGNIELVGVKNEGQKQENSQDEEEDEGNRQVQRFSARLTPGDVFIIPSSHPVAVNASSNLSIVGFGINAENNQRNFLTGEEDNVIRQIHEPVKELAFPGSAQEVDRLLKNQRQSYFANAQPQQREEESQRKRVLLSSI